MRSPGSIWQRSISAAFLISAQMGNGSFGTGFFLVLSIVSLPLVTVDRSIHLVLVVVWDASPSPQDLTPGRSSHWPGVCYARPDRASPAVGNRLVPPRSIRQRQTD